MARGGLVLFTVTLLLPTIIAMHRECRRPECKGRDYSKESCPFVSADIEPRTVDIHLNYVLRCAPGQLFVHFLKVYQDQGRYHEMLILKREDVIRHSFARVSLTFQNVFQTTGEFYGLHLIIDHNCTPSRKFTKKRVDLLGCCWTQQICNITDSSDLGKGLRNEFWFQESFEQELRALGSLDNETTQ